MFKRKKTILLILFSIVFVMQAFLLNNVEYEYNTEYCENRNKVDFRIIDMLILNDDRKVLEIPPGNWVSHFFKEVENIYYYKIEIIEVGGNSYSNSSLYNISSDFDIRKLTKYNYKYCIIPTVNDNLIAFGHYYEIIVKNN
jgi:hypothetical protein